MSFTNFQNQIPEDDASQTVDSHQRSLIMLNKKESQGSHRRGFARHSSAGSLYKPSVLQTTASRLANLYGDCITEMQDNEELKESMMNSKKGLKTFNKQVDTLMRAAHTGIRSEQVKYR